MTDENQDQTPNGNGNQDQTPDGTAGGGGTSEVNYEEKFKASQSEAIKLRQEFDNYKKNNPPKAPSNPEEPSDDEKKVRDIFAKIERERSEKVKQDDEMIRSGLDNLHSIHGDFDDKKLMSIVDSYGVYNDEGKVNWEKAYELYERLGGQAEYQPKPKKKPETSRTSDKTQVVVDKSQTGRKRSMHEIVDDGLRRLGHQS